MKAIMVMFDSLNRRYLPPYGNDWVKAPGFERLARHAVTFDTCYAGSLPCMPARRELHSGRYNFMHRGWSPLEPFDDSMPEILKNAGVHTHLVSDHGHYWEDGGASYHPRYSTWENVRGQEGDYWKADLLSDAKPDTIIEDPNPQILAFKARHYKQDAVNRTFRTSYDKSCQGEVFDLGLEFLERNKDADNWFLQIESFDPHEPFFTYEEFLDLYERTDVGKELDWPPYAKVREGEDIISHMREKYAAMISMCDKSLSRVLDFMDKNDMWKDTMLIVNTDHGFLLGEHGWWAKNMMPCYSEIVNTPLFIWDPRAAKRDEHRSSLVQTIDLPVTLLSYFGVPVPEDMQGKDLSKTILDDTPVRTAALFGYFGKQMNVTDGRYVYMRNASDPSVKLYEYTLMPSRMSWRMGKELEKAVLSEPFCFSKNMPLLKIPAADDKSILEYGTQLFDVLEDWDEEHPLDDKETEQRLEKEMVRLMKESDAPAELFTRLGLDKE